MDPKIEWSEAEGIVYDPGHAFVGPDAVLQGVFGRIPQDFDGFTVTPRNFIDGGDTIVVEGRYTGHWKSTGKDLDAQVVHVFDLKDGKVTRFQQYTDTAQFADVTGARGGA
jgi:ketosteroid isomerase-like protein